jgi:hypothetical protein
MIYTWIILDSGGDYTGETLDAEVSMYNGLIVNIYPLVN